MGLTPRLVGCAIMLVSLVTIEILKARGWIIPGGATWGFLAAAGATAVDGWYTGLAAALLAVFYLLHTYDSPGMGHSLASPVHLGQIATVAGTCGLLAEVLHRRKVAWRREAAARLAADAARLNEERFRAALRAAPIMVFNQDRNLRYTWFHSSIREVPLDNLVGKCDADIIDDPRDLANILAIKRWVLETGAGVRQEVSLRLFGVSRSLDVAIEPLRDGNGSINGITCAAVDISNLKQALEALRGHEFQLHTLNETLEQRVAERTAVAEHRANQLRRLASQLTLAEQRERRRLAQLLHDHLQQLLVGAKLGIGIARNQTQEAAILQSLAQVNNMLDQSIQVSRSLTVELSPAVLYDGGLSAGLQWLAGQMYEKYGLEIAVAIDRLAEPQGEDIRVLLFQAVRELLFNIVKHAGVKRANLVMGRLNEDRVRIVVADAGSGFDATHMVGSCGKGTGFGLFSIRERLEMLGGKLDINSTPGRGTEVTLLAPIHPATDAPAPKIARQAAKSGHRKGSSHPDGASSGKDKRIRVLLADDHKIMREGLASLLRSRREIEVVGEACDGQAAIELARQAHPDVVLMDVTMPGLSGIEATRLITAEWPYVRVIGLSMHVEPDMAAAMRTAGAVSYLSKSCDPDTVVATIRECSRHRAESSTPQETPARAAPAE